MSKPGLEIERHNAHEVLLFLGSDLTLADFAALVPKIQELFPNHPPEEVKIDFDAAQILAAVASPTPA